MKRPRIPKKALPVLEAVKGKRARIVIEHILKHGSITTEQLKEDYGYDHPPRAIRDVMDQGIPLEKTTTTSKEGRRIARYCLGDLSHIRLGRLGGRRQFPKTFKRELASTQGERCGLCDAKFETRALQVDHRVPYEVAGDTANTELRLIDFMLLCGSCNRAKSWSCEHCRNWAEIRSPDICNQCYWGNPSSFLHVAMQEIRRLDLSWVGVEVVEFDSLRDAAIAMGEPLPRFVKKALRRVLSP